MRKHFIFFPLIAVLFLISASLIFGGFGCSFMTEPPEIEGAKQGVVYREIRGVVEEYLKATLGSIPGADVNYKRAKELMAAEFAGQFKDDSFIPLSYCIQDGPLDARIKSANYLNNNSTAEVEAKYGGEWIEMWKFELKKTADIWKINGIECLK